MKRRDMLLGAGPLAWFGYVKPVRDASNDFQAVLARWDKDEHPDLRGVVVRQHDEIVAERYYGAEQPDTLHDVRSAGKSITSLLIGIAIDQGHIRSVTDTVSRYLPETRDAAIGDVALADVLTMRSGLAADDDVPTSPGNEDRLMSASDWIAVLKSVPRAHPPGSLYVYNSLTAYVAGLVVARAVGDNEANFARKTLFEPLGIERFAGASDPAGNARGQGNLSVTTRNLSRIGQMVLDRGRWKGRRIVSEDWIMQSLKPRVAIGEADPYADTYGYFWFMKTLAMGHAPIAVYFASGNGGNKIYVVPDRNVVIAITSGAYDHGYGQRRSQAILTALLNA